MGVHLLLHAPVENGDEQCSKRSGRQGLGRRNHLMARHDRAALGKGLASLPAGPLLSFWG